MRPWVFLVAGAVLLCGNPWMPALPSWPWAVSVPASTPATAAVYVYEKDATAIPLWVTTGLNRLNRERKVVATLVEADTTNGGGNVPEQYRPAVDAAKAGRLPALVVMGGQAVLRVVPAPASEAAVMEAVP